MDPIQNQNPMNINNQPPVGMEPQPNPSEKKSFGPMIGIIIVIVALVVGAAYLWGQRASEDVVSEDDYLAADMDSSDEISDIEADLIDDLDLDLDFSDLEAEINAELENSELEAQ